MHRCLEMQSTRLHVERITKGRCLPQMGIILDETPTCDETLFWSVSKMKFQEYRQLLLLHVFVLHGALLSLVQGKIRRL